MREVAFDVKIKPGLGSVSKNVKLAPGRLRSMIDQISWPDVYSAATNSHSLM